MVPDLLLPVAAHLETIPVWLGLVVAIVGMVAASMPVAAEAETVAAPLVLAAA